MSAKPLRFAALIRVSTEKQAQQGESLRTQRVLIERSVAAMGGTITAYYAGQEHATANWERKQLDKLLADAAKRPRRFDAVIVTEPKRWSRDNVSNQTGLDHLQANGIRFFLLQTEQKLSDPTVRLFLGMSATIGQYQAESQSYTSIENRIERSRRGIPTSGKVPFGRIWDKKNGEWQVDERKRSVIENIARRYLDGESLSELARECRINHSHLCKILRERCGEEWEETFDVPRFGIHEIVPHRVPRLLPDETIQRVRARLNAKRTFAHGKPKHDYLLNGKVFCGYCGRSLSGQANRQQHLYYRHPGAKRCLDCPQNPRPYVRADQLERVVVSHLFSTFGNPVAARRAIEQAIPNSEKIEEYRQRHQELDEEMAKIKKARSRIQRSVEDDDLSEEDAAHSFRRLKDRESRVLAERQRLEDALTGSPSAEQVKAAVDEIQRRLARGLPAQKVSIRRRLAVKAANSHFAAMTRDETRKLLDLVFSGTTADGKPMGVYVTAIDGQELRRQKKWQYEIRGIARVDGDMVVREATFDEDYGAAELRALHSPAPAPPAPHSPGRAGELPP